MLWTLASSEKTFWMPPQASENAASVDWAFYMILYISVFFTVLITALIVWFIIKYRARPGDDLNGRPPTHSLKLELTWTIIPTIIVLLIFYNGFRTFLHGAVPPPNAYEVQVIAKKWSWLFRYPNGVEDNELHLPRNRPVVFVLQSDDVIHSFFVPQFRIKKDCVPGRYNKAWVTATEVSPKEGWDLYCAEYCGEQHSRMLARVYVHDQKEFDEWMAKASNLTVGRSPAEAGKLLYVKQGCVTCHNLDGAPNNPGPTWKNLFGYERTFADGSKALADENYLSESIVNAQKRIVNGFGGTMPNYANMKPEYVRALVAYIQTQSDKYTPAATQPATQPATRP